MRTFFYLVLIVILNINALKAQDSIYTVIVNPDMKVEFPCTPKHNINGNMEKYETNFNDANYSITSEPFPIIYKGKTIAEAESEFYPTFTKRLIGNKTVKNLLEKDTMFEGHKVRELRFTEVLSDGKENYTFTRAIMVSGYKDALYIIEINSFDKMKLNNTNCSKFLSSLDLYFTLENKLDTKNENKNNKTLKKEGFKLDK